MAEGAIRSSIHSGTTAGFAFLRPVVRVRDAVKAVFDKTVEMMWGELMGEEDRYSQLDHLKAFAVFSALSLAQYHGRGWSDLVVMAFILLWAVDHYLARRAFAFGECRREVTLSPEPDGQWAWQREGEASRSRFQPSQAKAVVVARVRLLGGAFREVMGAAWRVSVDLAPSELPVYEEESAAEALRKGRELAGMFRVPLKVRDSDGRGPLASMEVMKRSFSAGTIVSSREAGGWRFSTRWTVRSLWVCVRSVVERAGFLLFVLGVMRLMTGFGAFVNLFVGPYFGWATGTVVIDLRPEAILGLFNPASDPVDFAEFCLAVGLLLHAGWRLGRRKTLVIEDDRTLFLVGGRIAGCLKTAALAPPLCVRGPDPVILLADGVQAFEIEGLHGDDSYEELMAALEERIPARPAGP
ncbi:MAG: hypothetical protein HY927_09550 [Elusimicrobia bacterium]|nr:hypothetical protein [Elusimicrobiota bacterium]